MSSGVLISKAREVLEHIAVALLVFMVTWAAISAFQARDTVLTTSVSIGSQLPDTIETEGFEFQRSVLFVVSPTCIYCWDNMPAYAEFIERAQIASSDLRFVAVVNDSLEIPLQRRIFERANISIPRIISHPVVDLGVEAYPTVLVVGRDRVVEFVAVGRLTPASMERALGMITHGALGHTERTSDLARFDTLRL